MDYVKREVQLVLLDTSGVSVVVWLLKPVVSKGVTPKKKGPRTN